MKALQALPLPKLFTPHPIHSAQAPDETMINYILLVDVVLAKKLCAILAVLDTRTSSRHTSHEKSRRSERLGTRQSI